MTPTQLQEIARVARLDAASTKAGFPVRCPYPSGSQAALVWQSRHDAALKDPA